jgi:hypothetical protein
MMMVLEDEVKWLRERVLWLYDVMGKRDDAIMREANRLAVLEDEMRRDGREKRDDADPETDVRRWSVQRNGEVWEGLGAYELLKDGESYLVSYPTYTEADRWRCEEAALALNEASGLSVKSGILEGAQRVVFYYFLHPDWLEDDDFQRRMTALRDALIRAGVCPKAVLEQTTTPGHTADGATCEKI